MPAEKDKLEKETSPEKSAVSAPVPNAKFFKMFLDLLDDAEWLKAAKPAE